MICNKPIVDIDLNLLDTYSCELAKKIADSGFIPEHVLYVERAGFLIGTIVAEYFDCSISGITASRSGGKAKSSIKFMLRYLPKFVTHFLRRVEIQSDVHGKKTERNIACEQGLPPLQKKILVVDDAIDTGNSIQAVIDFLLQNGFAASDLKIAVMTTTHPAPIRKADITFFDQTICAFPWSYDSREYTQAWQLYHDKKRELGQK